MCQHMLHGAQHIATDHNSSTTGQGTTCRYNQHKQVWSCLQLWVPGQGGETMRLQILQGATFRQLRSWAPPLWPLLDAIFCGKARAKENHCKQFAKITGDSAMWGNSIWQGYCHATTLTGVGQSSWPVLTLPTRHIQWLICSKQAQRAVLILRHPITSLSHLQTNSRHT